MSQQLQDAIPVFCTTPIPLDLLNEFFKQSLEVPELQGLDGIAVLVNSLDVTKITSFTKVPVEEQAFYPFQDWTVDKVAEFAEQNLDRGRIVPTSFAILDQRTVKDKTCLLITLKEVSEFKGERLTARADFRSSMVILNMKSIGVGGDSHFEIAGPDGVIRLDRDG